MGFIWSHPIRVQEQLRKREEQSRTVKISHPRTRILGVLRQGVRDPPLEYVAFLGIPYALPPVGQLRFQPPKELPQIPDDQPTPLFLASNGSHPCTQRFRKCKIIGSEDCLYLNVFTPKKPKDIPKLLPVLVYIHGGGFTSCQNNYVDPENFMREDLVVVTINYRLGIFGFLNMRTPECPGNVGLKDQVMALKWVRKNIEQFRGDSTNVTICGHSAGGTCVNLHMISPLSKGLFHKAIVLSGGIYSPWGYGGRSKYVKQLFKNATGKSEESRHATVDFLKQKNTFDLLKFGEDTMRAHITQLYPWKMMSVFKPSVEHAKEDAFLPDTVEKLMEVAEPVPTIAGITKQEGYLFFSSENKDENLIDYFRGKNKFVDLVKEVLRQNLSWNDPTAVDRHFAFFKGKYFPEEWMLEEEEDVKEGEEYNPTTEEEKQWKEEERKHPLATFAVMLDELHKRELEMTLYRVPVHKTDELSKEHNSFIKKEVNLVVVTSEIELCTDIMFRRFYDNFKIGNLLDEGKPHFYVYEFDYFAGRPLTDAYQHVIRPRAANHADDYFFLFGPKHLDNKIFHIAEKDCVRAQLKNKRVERNMSSLLSSFCRTGKPETRVPSDAHVKWKPHTEQDPHYLHIGERISLKKGRLNEERWPALNSICQLEPTIPSLPVTPQTPKTKRTELQQSQPELGSSSTQAPDAQCEVSQLPRPKPDQSATQTWTEVVVNEYR